MRQFQLHSPIKRKPRNRGMLVWLLIDRYSAPRQYKIHITLDLFVAFWNSIYQRFHMPPLRWRDSEFFLQLTNQGSLRLLAWLNVTAKDVPDAGIKAPRWGSVP
jgi:hypothetical protein